ncbi:YfiT family bacillithiol transferase [Paenibacillus sp. FSL M8-0334]|uniref:YfiT family bacillithiol transferase n=1 Tax=Paenibacillus sp. FSL M8-0334 TaxID=2921623 RepID=UPI0030F546F1
MDVRYPIGTFRVNGEITASQRQIWIREIEDTPAKLAATVAGLSPELLDTPYREGGWTVRQVVHHMADSHMNAYIRFKLALTEDQPVIKPYLEQKWAELPDSRTGEIGTSLALMEGIHQRWVTMLHSMSDDDFKRTFYHPETEQAVTLDYTTGTYAWHGNHHIAHIASLRNRLGI